MCVATRSRNHRSWLVITAQPGNSSNAFSRLASVSTSRSLVGSSSSSRLPPCLRVSARFIRLRSPPDMTTAGFCWSAPLNPNAATYARLGISTLPTRMCAAVGDDLPHVLLRVDALPALVHVGDADRLADADRALVGLLLADDHLEQRGLAHSVRPEDADDAVTGQAEGEVLEQ